MKKTVKIEVQEVAGEGLLALLDKKVMVYCCGFIYTGVLSGVNDVDILLTDASIVYNTGPIASQPTDASAVPSDLYIRTAAIECYYVAP